MEKVSTFCRVCEPSCALIAEVEGDQVLALKPDRDHPVTKGFACHKGLAVLDIHNDPDRLNHPMKRDGGRWVKTDWDDAADTIASRLRRIVEQHGTEAVASYTGNPLAFNSLAGPAISSFLVKNQIRKNFSSGTQDCANKFAAGEAIFGSSTIHPIPDIDNTDFLLAFGANPRVSHMSFISIADPVKALRDAARRGATIRFVDPRVNETVKGIGEVVQVHPDTDVYLMAAMLQHLHSTNQFAIERLTETAEHVDELILFVASFTPEAVANVVGISAAEIRKLADDFAAAPRAAVYMSTGVNMGRQGTLAYWLMFMLSVVTGNFDRPGGNLYSRGFYPAAKAGRGRGEIEYEQTPFGEIRKMRGSLPGNLMADMILAEENPIRAMIVISGNPVLSIGGGERLRRALDSLELLVVIDIYDNATAHYADFVLPATDMLERPDINICGLGMQKQPFVQYTHFIVPPSHDRMPEWWILGKLEQALGQESILDEVADKDLSYNELIEQLGLFSRFNHMLAHSDTTIDEIRGMPAQTIELPTPTAGRFFEEYIQTESGLIDCMPGRFAEALDRSREIFDELVASAGDDSRPLKLISRRTNYMINSWFHNVASLKREHQKTNPVFMNPVDARARNLGEGSTAKVYNEFGEVSVPVVLDETLKPGTVAMTHGWGHQATGMRVARKNPGVSANDLLPSGPGSFEKISNQAFMTGIPVQIDSIED